jgi:hypothetical protein
MPEHDWSITVTIWLALAGYAITVCVMLAGFLKLEWSRRLRAVWTISCGFFVLHVLSAFHYSYHWSHAEAIQSTARQTDELLGMRFGEGLYFSYGFLLLWIADVLFWWQRPELYVSRPGWLLLAVHAYLFFIAFNGAVVFKSGATRIAGIGATAIFIAVTVRRHFLRP